MADDQELIATVFSSKLGWSGLAWHGGLVSDVCFGYPAAEAAKQRLPARTVSGRSLTTAQRDLANRIKRFAGGYPDDFLDISLQLSNATRFQRRVIDACRKTPWGVQVTYGQLAARAGSPRAARAVGNIMANNRFPLIVPCHRVVGSNNDLCGFSAPGGLAMKRKLLERETASRRPNGA